MKMASIFEAFFTVVYYSIRDTYTCAHVRIYRPLQNQDWFYLFGTGSRGFLTHTHPFNGPFSGTTRVSRYQKGKTNLDLTKARDSEWQWHQLGHMHLAADR